MVEDSELASRDLVDRWRDGDQRAATAIHDRYVHRLIALARQRLAPRMAARFDPDDVVQSAYRSFFTRAREGAFVFERAGDLWRLLAQIVVHKLAKKIERNRAGRRSVDREQSAEGNLGSLVGREPGPDEVAASIEELECVMESLSPLERTVLRARLQGEAIDEIAEAIDRSPRTVRRLLSEIRSDLEKRSSTE